jgi:hypothetical protein
MQDLVAQTGERTYCMDIHSDSTSESRFLHLGSQQMSDRTCAGQMIQDA